MRAVSPGRDRFSSGPNASATSTPRSNVSAQNESHSLGLLNVLDASCADRRSVCNDDEPCREAGPALLRRAESITRLCLGRAVITRKVELYRRFFPDRRRWKHGNLWKFTFRGNHG